MKRSKLRSVIANACDGADIQGDERKRLVDSANDIDHVAVGRFKVEAKGIQCGCPATVAGFYLGENDEGQDHWEPGTSKEVRDFPHCFDRRMDTLGYRGEITWVRLDGEEYRKNVVEVTDE